MQSAIRVYCVHVYYTWRYMTLEILMKLSLRLLLIKRIYQLIIYLSTKTYLISLYINLCIYRIYINVLISFRMRNG